MAKKIKEPIITEVEEVKKKAPSSKKKVVANTVGEVEKVKKTAAKKVVKVKEEVPPVHDYQVKYYSKFTDFDISLFRAGKHFKLYEKFGSHVLALDGVVGTYFSVWAL